MNKPASISSPQQLVWRWPGLLMLGFLGACGGGSDGGAGGSTSTPVVVNGPADFSPTDSLLAAASNVNKAPGATATSTALAASTNPAQLNFPVTLTATVSPRPSSGTVSFSGNGSALPTCQTITIVGSGANCTVSFSTQFPGKEGRCFF